MVMKKILFLLFLISYSFSERYMIIVNTSVDVTVMNSDQVKRIFKGRVDHWEDQSLIIPCYIDSKNKEGAPFFTKFLKISPVRYKRYWLKKTFSGEAVAPKALPTPKHVLEFVSITPSSIAVVPEKYGSELPNMKRVELVAYLDVDIGEPVYMPNHLFYSANMLANVSSDP